MRDIVTVWYKKMSSLSDPPRAARRKEIFFFARQTLHAQDI
jgi:hypothetical protein